ncbi:hypothetical protein [Naasia aerilata]|nr:hypothetical protein [Naasia aerilata]
MRLLGAAALLLLPALLIGCTAPPHEDRATPGPSRSAVASPSPSPAVAAPPVPPSPTAEAGPPADATIVVGTTRLDIVTSTGDTYRSFDYLQRVDAVLATLEELSAVPRWPRSTSRGSTGAASPTTSGDC